VSKTARDPVRNQQSNRVMVENHGVRGKLQAIVIR
jgi:hypothetical protein